MANLGFLPRAALLLAGVLAGIVFSGTVTAWLGRARINEVRPTPPAKGEPAPDPRAEAGPTARGPA